MKPSSLTKLLALLILVAIVGCSLKPEYTTNPSVASIPGCPSRTESSRVYSDLVSNTLPTARAVVAALTFMPDGQSAWIAYSRELEGLPGQLVQVKLADWQVVRSVVLDSFSTRFTRFNGDATLIASANPVKCPTISGKPDGIPVTKGLCAEKKVWNTTTGELISVPRYPATNLEDVAFDKQGKWFLTAEGNLEISNSTESFGGSSIGIVGEEPDEYVTATFNNKGNLVAYGTKRKWIGIEGWDNRRLRDAYILDLGLVKNETRGVGQIDVIPIKLAIAPNNKWLAVQFDEGVELRDMSSGFFPQQGKVTLPRTSTGLLEFNPSGSLLAVGHSKGMKVLSIPNLKIVLDKPGAQVTAIAFSPDGCLLAWGDTEGTVHIVGSPKP